MKDWVIPYLLGEAKKRNEEEKVDPAIINEILKKKSDDYKEAEEYVFSEITDYINFNFSFGGGLGAQGDQMTNNMGSVLADLPYKEFKKLIKMKKCFFTFSPVNGAEVKTFIIDSDIKSGEKINIVTIPFASSFMPVSAIRGELIHEIVHICMGIGGTIEDEEKVDEIACEWGFENEINALRKYNKEVLGEKI